MSNEKSNIENFVTGLLIVFGVIIGLIVIITFLSLFFSL